MEVFLRKFDKGKWFKNGGLASEIDNISADAITNCMKTSKNNLSVWHCDDKSKINDVALAIISQLQHIETIDIVCLDKISLEKHIELNKTRGITPANELVENHYDLTSLTFSKLGTVADQILQKLIENEKVTTETPREERFVRRYTKKEVKNILEKAVEENKINIDLVNQNVVKKLNL